MKWHVKNVILAAFDLLQTDFSFTAYYIFSFKEAGIISPLSKLQPHVSRY